MADPVVHFEVSGRDPDRLRAYYGELFGWKFDLPAPVAAQVSAGDQYGFVDLMTAEDSRGIRGGIGGGEGYPSQALFYVGVADVESALAEAERLGGSRVLGPSTSPSGLVVGQFRDPEGTLIGVAGAT